MSFQNIMEEIASGLTGDSEKDIAYLKEQQEKYRDHEMSPQISKAIGRLMYRAMPEDRRREFDEAVKKQKIRWNEALEGVQKERSAEGADQEKLEEALARLEEMTAKIEELLEQGRFRDDGETEYHCFFEMFEMILYEQVSGTKKRQKSTDDVPVAAVYAEYGTLLMELGRTKEAQAALEKAVRWAPANCRIAFEYAETFKVLGEMDSFLKITADTFRYVFRPAELARCYRNLGYYFIELEKWNEATACYLMSLQFDKDAQNAQAELYFISQKTGGELPKPSVDEIRVWGKEYGFPVGPDENVVRTAVKYGMEYYRGGRYDLAQYFLKTAFDLTGDERLGKLAVSAVNAMRAKGQGSRR